MQQEWSGHVETTKEERGCDFLCFQSICLSSSQPTFHSLFLMAIWYTTLILLRLTGQSVTLRRQARQIGFLTQPHWNQTPISDPPPARFKRRESHWWSVQGRGGVWLIHTQRILGHSQRSHIVKDFRFCLFKKCEIFGVWKVLFAQFALNPWEIRNLQWTKGTPKKQKQKKHKNNIRNNDNVIKNKPTDNLNQIPCDKIHGIHAGGGRVLDKDPKWFHTSKNGKLYIFTKPQMKWSPMNLKAPARRLHEDSDYFPNCRPMCSCVTKRHAMQRAATEDSGFEIGNKIIQCSLFCMQVSDTKTKTGMFAWQELCEKSGCKEVNEHGVLHDIRWPEASRTGFHRGEGNNQYFSCVSPDSYFFMFHNHSWPSSSSHDPLLHIIIYV